MGFAMFTWVILLLLASAAYVVFRIWARRFTCREVAERLTPLSDHAREVLWEDTQDHVPTTYLEFGDMYKAANNLTWLTLFAGQFRRAIRTCSDDYCLANMQLTYRTFLRKRTILVKSLLVGMAHLCFGKIGKRHICVHMGRVVQTYADLVVLGSEMAEVMDESCVPFLEGQFLHGS
jgi:hypothetical protein